MGFTRREVDRRVAWQIMIVEMRSCGSTCFSHLRVCLSLYACLKSVLSVRNLSRGSLSRLVISHSMAEMMCSDLVNTVKLGQETIDL